MSNFYKSDCGNYLCRDLGGATYEAWSMDGKTHWRNSGRENIDYPLPYSIGGYSCQKTGQKKGSFTLCFLHCNPEIKIIPFRGNTIIDQFNVVFRRKVQQTHIPRWLKERGSER